LPARPPVHRPPWAKSRQQAERERKALLDRKRPSARQRGYDHEWQQLRAAFIEANPRCSVEGCGKPTHDVDHRIPIRKRPDLRLAWANLRAFCRSHHAAHTARTTAFARPRVYKTL
jgi:5-methylcytosine-specific restriction protein A